MLGIACFSRIDDYIFAVHVHKWPDTVSWELNKSKTLWRQQKLLAEEYRLEFRNQNVEQTNVDREES